MEEAEELKMRKYLSLIGVLLVLVVFHLGPNAEAQVVELDSGLLYASPALLLGINFDFGGGDGLEFYPSLSAQVTGGMVFTGLMGGVLSHEESTIPMVGATFGYQFIWGIQTISMLTSKTACGLLGLGLVGLGNPVLK